MADQRRDDTAPDPDETPETHAAESDPNADRAEGLIGGMGVSSERTGPVRGVEGEATYGAAPYPAPDEGPAPVEPDLEDTPPEQAADAGLPEVNPPSPGKHRSDPKANPGHGV